MYCLLFYIFMLLYFHFLHFLSDYLFIYSTCPTIVLTCPGALVCVNLGAAGSLACRSRQGKHLLFCPWARQYNPQQQLLPGANLCHWLGIPYSLPFLLLVCNSLLSRPSQRWQTIGVSVCCILVCVGHMTKCTPFGARWTHCWGFNRTLNDRGAAQQRQHVYSCWAETGGRYRCLIPPAFQWWMGNTRCRERLQLLGKVVLALECMTLTMAVFECGWWIGHRLHVSLLRRTWEIVDEQECRRLVVVSESGAGALCSKVW